MDLFDKLDELATKSDDELNLLINVLISDGKLDPHTTLAQLREQIALEKSKKEMVDMLKYYASPSIYFLFKAMCNISTASESDKRKLMHIISFTNIHGLAGHSEYGLHIIVKPCNANYDMRSEMAKITSRVGPEPFRKLVKTMLKMLEYVLLYYTNLYETNKSIIDTVAHTGLVLDKDNFTLCAIIDEQVKYRLGIHVTDNNLDPILNIDLW